ncbi:hypothetical protein CBR_g19879 [Chara braunii]|uniref:Reverse transcriptase RNase H-like domain-containing protein n=1 Tax=Chara braunii TaxID=69332 RepID=A0A388KYV8_CHABU|nr:hypothetical protein CBR_g19879 [Chara braunii]|eukprot:GBG75244.1 hypothetical protein CBR_g19879 [Chara braunii]
MKGHVIRFCQILAKDEKDHVVFTTIRGEVFDYEGNLIDQDIEGGMRKEAFRRMGRPLPATFRRASPEEASLFELEKTMASLEIGGCDEKELKERKEDIAHRAREVTRKLGKCRDSIIQLCVDIDRVWPNLPNVFLFGGWGNEGQDGSAPAATSAQEAKPMALPMTMSRPVLKRGMPTVMVQTRKGRKTSQLQPASGESSKEPQEKEPIQIEEGDDDEEDERLRAEDELLAKQRAMERASEAGKTQVEEEEPRKKKNVYSIPVEQGIDFEQLVDRILESRRDLVTLKEILAVSSKLREEFKQRMTRKKIMTMPGVRRDLTIPRYLLVRDTHAEDRPFIIETDAGPTALGGVLVQKDGEGRERPLRFESRTLNITERNYSQFKKETLAVLHCLRIFMNYVIGRRFILRVDPTALAHSLKNYSPSDPTISRWLIYIWMFNFEIECISDTQNRADGLSRVDWDSSTDQAENSVPVDGFLEGEESQLSINSNNYLADATTRHGKTIWNAPCFHHVRSELVIGEPFIEQDLWGERTYEQMMKLALSDEVELIKEPLTIENGHEQADKTFRIAGEMSFLVNSLIHEDRLKMMNKEAEGNEIRETFREGEYDGKYKLMGMWLNGELREDEVDPDVREKSTAKGLKWTRVMRDCNGLWEGILSQVL